MQGLFRCLVALGGGGGQVLLGHGGIPLRAPAEQVENPQVVLTVDVALAGGLAVVVECLVEILWHHAAIGVKIAEFGLCAGVIHAGCLEQPVVCLLVILRNPLSLPVQHGDGVVGLGVNGRGFIEPGTGGNGLPLFHCSGVITCVVGVQTGLVVGCCRHAEQQEQPACRDLAPHAGPPVCSRRCSRPSKTNAVSTPL